MDALEKRYLKRGMLKTLKRLPIGLYPYKNMHKPMNLNAVTALCICCFIDALGKYLFKTEQSKCRFKLYIEKYMPDLYNDLKTKALAEKHSQDKYLDQLYTEVRCGLVHEYFTKSKSKIKSTGKLVDGTKDTLVINTTLLVTSFISSIDKSLKDL